MAEELDAFNEMYQALVENIDPSEDIDITTTKIAAVHKFADSLPAHLCPEPPETPVPTAGFAKFWYGFKQAAKSENAGIALKVGGGLATTALVVYATIIKDHNLEKNAFQQMNQKL